MAFVPLQAQKAQSFARGTPLQQPTRVQGKTDKARNTLTHHLRPPLADPPTSPERQPGSGSQDQLKVSSLPCVL